MVENHEEELGDLGKTCENLGISGVTKNVKNERRMEKKLFGDFGRKGKIGNASESYRKPGDSWEELEKLGDLRGHQKCQKKLEVMGLTRAHRGPVGLTGVPKIQGLRGGGTSQSV